MFNDIIPNETIMESDITKSGDDIITLKITGAGNRSSLIKMLAWIELLGSVGHSTNFKVYVDGDGSSRCQFKFDDKEQQKIFNNLKKELRENHINTQKDIESLEL